MRHIALGIHMHTEPQGLQATLNSLGANTRLPTDLLLLPDGPDKVTVDCLGTLSLPQSGTAEPRGAPSCFNRLITTVSADIYVLLESGTLVGPGWLHHLLVALDADPRHGLAGPSTNRSWNEQAVFPNNGGSPAQVSHTAEQAARRFGEAWHVLEPLHSLADFCYAVRSEVVQVVGAADEAYGLGPCWEMDYNIRAARAGFRGVWAQAAYVYRSTFTPRRSQMETRYFEANKRRYQDKFCELRLRGERGSYEPHCRGDHCEHFAPPKLIQIKFPLPQVAFKSLAPSEIISKTSPNRTPLESVSVKTTSSLNKTDNTPLVSCIMPTANRMTYVMQSIYYFRQQTYPKRELIIVDSGDDDLQAQLPDDPLVTYLRVSPERSIGEKRNQACEIAKGEVIAQWDDDDWYAPTRLENQIKPLLTGEADITAFNGTVFFELDRWQFWKTTANLHRRLFVEDVHGGTLVYWRKVWKELARYPNRSLAEDAVFLQQAIRRRARLTKLSNDYQFMYLRHGGQ